MSARGRPKQRDRPWADTVKKSQSDLIEKSGRIKQVYEEKWTIREYKLRVFAEISDGKRESAARTTKG